jgi:AraC-like DNA-binding protein
MDAMSTIQTGCHVPSGGIHFFDAFMVRLHEWKFNRLAAPYWRFCWMADTGAQLVFGEQCIDAAPNLLILVAPNTPFDCNMEAAKEQTRSVRMHYFHFQLGSTYDLITPRIYTCPCPPNLRQQLEQLADTFETEEPDAPLRFSGLACMSHALNQIPTTDWPRSVRNPKILAIIQQMDQTLDRRLSNEEIAKHNGMSTRTFQRLFTAETGFAPQNYHLRRRLNHACLLLEQSEQSIDEIAQATGFPDRSYFTRIFTRKVGTSPAAYRRSATGA